MDPALAQLVRQRAGDRCEYCRLPQSRSWIKTAPEDGLEIPQPRGRLFFA